ncbi:MAG: isoprenylcysteine carboxylmethyltransferase family protein [Planctomycetes bacterium]|nr:isoprenylcysteine carboxylmethyltransferase family protein [Planctomycetota bacterium]
MPLKPTLIFLFGIVSYFIFFFTFLYQIGFVENMVVPKAMNDGVVGSFSYALMINLGLLGLFAIQHTIMARLAFKKWWTKIVPKSTERSIFVLFTSLLLLLLNWQWVPLPEIVWQTEMSGLRNALYFVSFAGWAIVLLSTFLIDHFDLFGLRQVWFFYTGREDPGVKFQENLVYSWVRHPIMLGFIIAFWATPDMTQGHLLFAAVTTAYILIGVRIEERTLIKMHGDDYLNYRKRVSMIIPRPPKSHS